MSTGTIIFLVIAVALIFLIINIYNNLVKLKNRFQNAFAQIDVQLKRRHDLIPNLVEVAQGYLKHERETLEAVISARNAAAEGLAAAKNNMTDGSLLQQLGNAEGMLSNALGKLSVVVEAYPELKANENMMQLSEELTSTENRVGFARQAFNDAVTAYNEYKQSFPPVFFAGFFGHRQDASLLEFEDRAAIQEAPKVSF